MTIAYFISDLHLGHKNIIKFAGEKRYGTTIEEHDGWLQARWAATVRERDLVYVLGDVAFTKDALLSMRGWSGTKVLVMGNHDKYDINLYQQVFNKILPSPWPYHNSYWLSHCPIHPAELRGRKNIHGHVHMNEIPDERYISVCVEAVAGIPTSIEQLNKRVVGVNRR